MTSIITLSRICIVKSDNIKHFLQFPVLVFLLLIFNINKASANEGVSIQPSPAPSFVSTPSGILTVNNTTSISTSSPNLGDLLKMTPGQSAISSFIPKTPICEVFGDVNLDNRIDSNDTDIMNNYVAGKPNIVNSIEGGWQHISAVGDVNADNKVDADDIQITQQYIEGTINTIPACQSAKSSPCNGLGDVTGDGKVTIIDTNEILRYLVGFKTSLYTKQILTKEQLSRADTNGDGKVGISDSVLILRFVAGLSTTFKGCVPTATLTPTATVSGVVLPDSVPASTPLPAATPSGILALSSSSNVQTDSSPISPGSITTGLVSPSPTSVPSSLPTPTLGAAPVSSSLLTSSNNISSSVSTTASPNVTSNITASGVLAVSGAVNTYSGNEGVVKLVPSAQNSTSPSILTTGVTFILEGIKWGLGLFENIL